MGWTQDITVGAQWDYFGRYVQPEATKNNLPYLVAKMGSGTPPHSLLGINQPGRVIGTAVFEGPLIIASNRDLVKASGAPHYLR